MKKVFNVLIILFVLLFSFAISKDNQTLVSCDLSSFQVSVDTQVKKTAFCDKKSFVLGFIDNVSRIVNKRTNRNISDNFVFFNPFLNNSANLIFKITKTETSYIHNCSSLSLKEVICIRAP